MKHITIFSRLWFLFFCLTFIWANPVFAQEDDTEDNGRPHIDSAMAFSPDYVPVYKSKLQELIYKPFIFNPIDTSVEYIHRSDPMMNTSLLYQNLGIAGQAHRSICFDYNHDIGFSYLTLPYPLYFKTQNDLEFYDLKSAYTKIAYTYGISTENTISAIHAQKIKGVSFVFNLNGVGNEGYYAHQSVSHTTADFLIHYEIPSGIYGFRASYIFNHFKLQENAGLYDQLDFINQASSKLAGYNLKLYNALSTTNTHDALFQQYVNLMAKSKKSGKSHYLGTITHTFQFKTMKSRYLDSDLDSLYYDNFFFSSDTTNDTIHYYSVINSIQWSSYKPFETQSTKKYFFHFSGGLRHEYIESFPKGAKTVTNRYFGNTFTLFGNVITRLFSVVDLQADLAYSFSDYNHNDAIANLKADFFINRTKQHYLGFQAKFNRLAPDYMLSYFDGNNFHWDTTWAKQNILKLSAYWNYGRYRAAFNYFMLDNYALIDSSLRPISIDKIINVVQLNLFAPFRYKGFGFDLNACLQYSDNNYIDLPVFAGKLAVFYVFHFFEEKMRLQLGIDLAYNTEYYAYGYCPALHQFYSQQEIKTGNYLYCDAYINMRIKRVGVFFRLGHAFAGLLGRNYFSTPYYPSQGRSFSLGINWCFYD
ncbi:MAG: putative porin [Bacteroidales bacterium]|nr:putative porin [Bacteroidales bacterium]